MKVARKIDPPPWMTAPETKVVMDILNADDEENSQAMFVGGCVRNEIMKKNVAEIDIATKLSPEDVSQKLEQGGIKVIPTGLEHGTVTAVINQHSFEITTLRRDVETHGRHATVEYTDDWLEDALRRDFTMNTLLADMQGHIYDPTGEGLADLEAGKVTFVGHAGERITEDYLRILRFFRFHAYYGKGDPDQGALSACAKFSDKITELSRERITQEFLKILAAENAPVILNFMFESNVLKGIADQNYDPAVLARLANLQKDHELLDVVTRLIIINEDTDSLGLLLVLSNKQKKSFSNILKAFAAIADTKDKTLKVLLYKCGAEITGQALLLYEAIHGKTADMELVKNWRPPEFPLNGDDVIKAGISSGPQVGEVLDRVEQWWLDHDMQPGREECLQQIPQNK